MREGWWVNEVHPGTSDETNWQCVIERQASGKDSLTCTLRKSSREETAKRMTKQLKRVGRSAKQWEKNGRNMRCFALACLTPFCTRVSWNMRTGWAHPPKATRSYTVMHRRENLPQILIFKAVCQCVWLLCAMHMNNLTVWQIYMLTLPLNSHDVD